MIEATILIPSYEPNQVLHDLIKELFFLSTQDMFRIIVIDDGSRLENSKAVFDGLSKMTNVFLLHHPENQGKGAALKTGMGYVSATFPNNKYIVTVDADGQHLPEDVVRILSKLVECNKPILGVRTFGREIPFRSLLGNKITAFLFKIVYKIDLKDTQCGLRGLPVRLIPGICDLPQNRYDFEFEMLIKLIKTGECVQIPITTVYEPGNPSSHFNPIVDSLRIYAVFFRQSVLSLVVSIIYFVLFYIFVLLNSSTILSLILARLASLCILFPAARNIVFKSKGNLFEQFSKYTLLVFANLLFLWCFITAVNNSFNISKVTGMIVGQVLFFVANFWIQKELIFRRDKQ